MAEKNKDFGKPITEDVVTAAVAHILSGRDDVHPSVINAIKTNPLFKNYLDMLEEMGMPI